MNVDARGQSAGQAAGGSGGAAEPMPTPGEGMFVLRLDVDPLMLGDVSRAVDVAPVYLCGSEVRKSDVLGSFEQELYLEYARIDDVVRLMETLRKAARSVVPVRAWCAECGRWHDVSPDARVMLAPEDAPCRARQVSA